MKESLFLMAAGLTMLVIAMGSFGWAIILDVFRALNPAALWFGAGYWPTILLFILIFTLLVTALVNVVKRMVRGY